MSGRKPRAQKFREDRQRCYRVLSDYYYLLKKWGPTILPGHWRKNRTPFVEAIQKKTYVEYLLDLFLMKVKKNKGHGLQNTAEITHLERRLKIMAENKPTNREGGWGNHRWHRGRIKELFESEKKLYALSVRHVPLPPLFGKQHQRSSICRSRTPLW